MPPETDAPTTETPETPVAVATTPGLPNTPEARTPTGELKDGLSAPPKTPPTTGETKSTESTKPEEPKPGDAKVIPGAPEKYEFKDIPDGFEITPDAEDFMRKNGFSQEQADNAVKFYVKKLQEAAEGPHKLWKAEQDKWLGEIIKDPEYKGDLEGIKSTISKFIDQVNNPRLATEMREAMNFTGAGNNPAFVKFMYRMAEQYTEGGHVGANGPSPHGQRAPGTAERPSAARSMYPNLS